MAKFLVVEDNVEEAEILSQWLKHEKNVVDVVRSAEDALQLLPHYQYDVLIVDWELPGKSGAELCKAYRAHGGQALILMLTGRADTGSKAAGLDSGADDYLTKPYDLREAGARIRALLRRPPQVMTKVIAIGDVELDTTSRAVKVGAGQVELTQREMALLEFLMRHQNQAFSSKALLNAVWPLESALSEDTVRSCMRNLRKKLADAGNQSLIQTVQGFGYIISS
jgi:DNA-binding response OmpR family regulator